jgi:pimeloyl-ACP methyl ester carboxylesterase
MTGCGSSATSPALNRTADANANQTTVVVDPAFVEQRVTFASADGVQIVGSMYATFKSGAPSVLLLHQWQSDRTSYAEFAKRLQEKHINVLAIDGRGFGESTRKADGSPVTAGRSDADVKAMLADVGAAIEFLKSQNNAPDPKRIGIVGASYGSSLAIIYAADHPDIKAVALLSPGLNYFGNMPTRPAVEKYGERNLFMVASKGDQESAKALEGLRINTPKHGFMELPTGSSHGTAMFSFRNTTDGPAVVEDAVESFLVTRLAGESEKSEP